MNQPLEPVAAIDPHRPREPIVLNHYTVPSLYAKARDFAVKHQYVPLPITTAAVYYINRYGQPFIDHWQKHVGPDLYSHTLFRVHGMMLRDMEELENPTRASDRALIPLPSMFMVKLFQSAIAFHDPLCIQVAWEAYDHYRLGVAGMPDLKHMAELLYEPFAMLNHSKDKMSHAVLRNYHKLLQYALSRQTLPAQGMAIALSKHAETELHHIAVALPDWELPDRPSLDDEEAATPKATQSPVVAEEMLLDPSPNLEDYVEHIDGSTGLSAQKELEAILHPSIDFIPDPKGMYRAVTQDLKGIWLDAVTIWWKTNGAISANEESVREVWALEPTIRFIQHAFTEEQFTILTQTLPMEELVDWSLQFVASSVEDPPDLSWEQIRISIVSVSLARIAHIANTSLMDLAIGVYESIGLHDEIPLLHVTMEIMQEGLEEQAQHQLKTVKSDLRH